MFRRHLGETESQRCALEERTAEGSTPPRAVCICIRNHSLSLTVTSVEHKCNRSDGATVIDWVCTNLGVQRPFIWEEIACAAAEPLQLNYDWLGRKNVFIFAAMTYSRCRHGGWLSAETPRPSPPFSVADLGASDGWLPLVNLGIRHAEHLEQSMRHDFHCWRLIQHDHPQKEDTGRADQVRGYEDVIIKCAYFTMYLLYIQYTLQGICITEVSRQKFFIEPRRKAPTWFVSCSDVTQARTWKPFFWEEINRRQNNGMIYLAPPCFQWLNVTALFCQGWGLLIKIGNVNRCHLFYASVFARVLFIIVHHCCSTRKSVLSLTGFRELQWSVNTMKNKFIH